ncbi:MAG: hypothetical protein AAF961_07770 [Planctomycetota bacterium]
MHFQRSDLQPVRPALARLASRAGAYFPLFIGVAALSDKQFVPLTPPRPTPRTLATIAGEEDYILIDDHSASLSAVLDRLESL